MPFLVGLLFLAAIVGGVFIHHWLQQEQAERVRDRASVQVIEGQLAALRAALRIQVAERAARRHMHATQLTDPFTHSTLHEEPEEWR
jgi:hypothetical protein